MIKRLVMLFILGTFIQLNSAYAQGCEVDEPGSNDSIAAPSIKIFGYIQPQFDYNFTEGDQDNTFRFKRARVGARGKIYKEFSYYFLLEASPFIGNQSDTYLMDAFVTYNADNWARISFGSYKQPFSLDVATPCFAIATIERSIVADQLVAPQRDFGVGIFGGNKYNKLNYAVALMNGSGIGGSNPKDNNTKKDISGRATYKITDFLTIGGSFRFGYPIPNDNDSDRTSFGGELLMELNKLTVQGEYIYDEGAYFLGAGGGCGAEPVALGEKRDGAYILATYSVNEKLQPVLKYEYFDPDIDTKDDGSYQERMTLGFNYFFNEKVRLQVNYLANIETVVDQDNDALLVQMQVRF